jgi:hypothetical protein
MIEFNENIETPLYSFDAYSINPEGEITGVPEKHINRILDHPEYFGYTRDEVLSRYEKYNEPIGWEGRARDEIFIELFSKGWIRVRKNKDISVSIQTGTYGKKEKAHIKKLALMMLENKVNMQFSAVITTFKGGEIRTSLSDLAKIKA